MDITSVDWASLYGDCLPDRIYHSIFERYETDGIPIRQIRLGRPIVRFYKWNGMFRRIYYLFQSVFLAQI